MPYDIPRAAHLQREFLRRRMSTLMFTSGSVCPDVPRALADSSNLGLLGNEVLQNGRFPAQDADEPPFKI